MPSFYSGQTELVLAQNKDSNLRKEFLAVTIEAVPALWRSPASC